MADGAGAPAGGKVSDLPDAVFTDLLKQALEQQESKLKLSGEEQQNLLRAMDKPEFTSLMKEYMDEISKMRVRDSEECVVACVRPSPPAHRPPHAPVSVLPISVTASTHARTHVLTRLPACRIPSETRSKAVLHRAMPPARTTRTHARTRTHTRTHAHTHHAHLHVRHSLDGCRSSGSSRKSERNHEMPQYATTTARDRRSTHGDRPNVNGLGFPFRCNTRVNAFTTRLSVIAIGEGGSANARTRTRARAYLGLHRLVDGVGELARRSPFA